MPTNVKDVIKERLSIVDVISHYVQLKPAGANYVGLSPFTQEKTPSFYVSPDRGLYYCFSTSQGGDMFTFVEKMEGVDFRGALKILAEKAGVSLNEEDRQSWEERDILFAIMEEATCFFQQQLKKNIQAQSYLMRRGLTEDTIESFRLGFSPLGWRDLKEHLLSKKYGEAHIEKAGLVKYGEKGSYDRFRSRIMFPISDSSGRVIAFSGRIFIEDETQATEDQKNAAKYLNSPDTPLFNKSDIFFGLDKAKNAIKKYNFAVLVEGQMDLLLLHQIGYTNTIAGSGTALTDKTTTREGLVSHMGILKRLTKNIILAYDSDKAGVNAAKKAARIALSLGMNTKAVELPNGYDPADYVKEFGKEAWASLVKNSISIIELLTKRIVSEEKDFFKKSLRVRDEVLQEIHYIPSAIEQDYYLKRVAELSAIPYSALQKDFMQISGSLPISKDELSEEKMERKKTETLAKVFGFIWYLEDRSHFDKQEKIIAFTKRFSGKLYEEWFKKFENRKQELIFEAEIDVSQSTLESCIEDVALDILRYLKPIYKRSIDQLEKTSDQKKLTQIMIDFNLILKMIQSREDLKQELYGTKKENN